MHNSYYICVLFRKDHRTIDVSFLFCLISPKIKYLLMNCIEQTLLMSTEKFSACQNNMALSGLRENIILAKIIPTTDSTDGCAKGDTWCQRGGKGCFFCTSLEPHGDPHTGPRLYVPTHVYTIRRKNMSEGFTQVQVPTLALNRFQINSNYRHSINHAQIITVYMIVPYTERLSKIFKMMAVRWGPDPFQRRQHLYKLPGSPEGQG